MMITEDKYKKRLVWLKAEIEKRGLKQYDIFKLTEEDPDLITVRRSDISNWLRGHYRINGYVVNFFVLWFERYDQTIKNKR